MTEEVTDLPRGYKLVKDEDLIVPVALRNDDDFKDIMTRESIFSFPSAAAGTAIAGPPGTVAGHIAGSVSGYIRHKQLESEE